MVQKSVLILMHVRVIAGVGNGACRSFQVCQVLEHNHVFAGHSQQVAFQTGAIKAITTTKENEKKENEKKEERKRRRKKKKKEQGGG